MRPATAPRNSDGLCSLAPMRPATAQYSSHNSAVLRPATAPSSASRSSVYEARNVMEEKVRSVHEARIANAYVEEKVLHGLHRMAWHERGRQQRAHQTEVMERNRRADDCVATPVTRRRAKTAETNSLIEWGEAKQSPRFRDLEDHGNMRTTPLTSLRSSCFSSRPLSVGSRSSGYPLGSPVTADDIARSVQLPGLSAVMLHPPRHETLPDKRLLMPSSPRALSQRDGPSAYKQAKFPILPTNKLLPMLSRFFYDKCSADAPVIDRVAQKGINILGLGSGGKFACDHGLAVSLALLPLSRCVMNSLTAQMDKEMAEGRFNQIKSSCTTRPTRWGGHPRMELFRRMAGWGNYKRFTLEQEIVCMRLLQWMHLASADSNAEAHDVLVSSHQIELLLKHLKRVAPVPTGAIEYMLKLAQAELQAAQGRLASPHSHGVVVDADKLLLRWMVFWGGWDETEAIRRSLLNSVPPPPAG